MNPRFPKVGSLPSRALARLAQGSLTHISFQQETRTYRLSASIFVLRKKGWQIDGTETRGLTSDPCGRFADYYVYRLNAEQLTPELADYSKQVFEWEKKRKDEQKYKRTSCSGQQKLVTS